MPKVDLRFPGGTKIMDTETQTRVFKAVDEYHAHLDTCKQCERQPFKQCAEGARLLEVFAKVHEESGARKPLGYVPTVTNGPVVLQPPKDK